MAKFNTQPQTVAEALHTRADATVNHEGGLAFALDARTRLVTRVLSALMGEDKFYTSAEEADGGLLADVQEVAARDPVFVLRLAAYARQVMHLRSAPVAMLCAAASIPAAKPFVRAWTPQIVRRADELAEVVACWIAIHGDVGARKQPGGEHTFPHCLRKGLTDAFARFDEYALAKYDRDRAVRIRDVLRIVRPKPATPAQAALWKYLVSGDLNAEHLPLLAAKAQLLRKASFDAEAVALAADAHATWEVLVARFGRSAEVWNALDLPFMAGLRNIANLMRCGADNALDRVIAMLHDPERVLRSQQLPYRFYSAWRLIESGTRPNRRGTCAFWVPDPAIANHPRRTEVLEALVRALELSVMNVPRLSGVTFITADNSGSMLDPLSEQTIVQRRNVANLLAALAHHLCDSAITSVFGESHAVVPIIRQDSILTNMDRLAATNVGLATNAWLAMRHLRDTKTVVNRIILFSDMQCYGDDPMRCSYWSRGSESLATELMHYRREVNPEVFCYSVDLAGYGTAQFPQDDPRTAVLAGWSERMLEFIPRFEAGATRAVDEIAAWEPDVPRAYAA